MRLPSVILLASAAAALAASGCFDDPTSDLRGGPALIATSRSAVILRTGDSVDVSAFLKDEQGNVLPIEGATWTSADQSVATVRADTAAGPGASFARAFILGVIDSGGITNVTVESRGQSASVRVVVRPALLLSRLFGVTGTAGADTVITARPAPLTPDTNIFTAGDTLTLNASGNLLFDTNTVAGSHSQVTFGANRGYIMSRTPTQIVVLARAGFVGRPAISNVLFAGNAETGEIRLDTLYADSVRIQRARLASARVTVRSGTFGANTEVKVTPPAGTTFTATSSTVVLGSTTGTILFRSADSIIVISTANITGTVKVTALRSSATGGGVVDSLRTNASSTVVASNFPGTVTQLGTGRLLDTVLVIGGPNADFNTSTSNVTINGATAFVLRRAADTLYVISKLGGTSTVAVSNVIVGTTTISSLATSSTITVSTATTGELNEPANDAPGAVTIDFSTATSANPLVIYGAIDDGATDIDDFFGFTLASARTVTIQLQMAGTGGGGAASPDLDLYACNAACTAFVGGFGGAVANQPENLVISNLAAGTYNIYVNGYNTGGTKVAYKLVVY